MEGKIYAEDLRVTMCANIHQVITYANITINCRIEKHYDEKR